MEWDKYVTTKNDWMKIQKEITFSYPVDNILNLLILPTLKLDATRLPDLLLRQSVPMFQPPLFQDAE
jgi:hypothetical protein